MSSWFIRLIVVGAFLSSTVARCPAGWKKWGQSCYALYLSRKNRAGASLFCADRGASLIVPNSQAENDFIRGMVRGKIDPGANSSRATWIGCWRESASSIFKCSDGQREMTYENWQDGKLDNDKCVALYRKSGKWAAVPCHRQRFVACEMPDIPRMYCLTADANGRFVEDFPRDD